MDTPEFSTRFERRDFDAHFKIVVSPCLEIAMLFCNVCRRELVGDREVEKTEAIHEIMEDPMVGWILGPKISKPIEGEHVECGCGRFEFDQICKRLEAQTVIVRSA